jgi:hypothetical protein
VDVVLCSAVLGEFLEATAIARYQHQICAFGSELGSERFTDAGGRTGDECALP